MISKQAVYRIADREIHIAPMQKEDVKEAAALEAAAFSMPWSEAALLSMTDREDALYVVAKTEGTVIGMCGVINGWGDGDISNVTVAETFRGLGIGKTMLKTLLLWGSEIGVIHYTLEVRVSNKAAIKLYESLGFCREGIRPGFYEMPKEDALIMWKRQETDG